MKDLEPGAGGSGPRSLTAAGDTLYFDAFTTAGGRALWRSDGTPGGTVEVKRFANQQLRSLTAVGSLLYFTADDGVNGRELWRSDGTPAGTFTVRDIDPTGSSTPTMLTPFGTQLVFAASGPEGTELWRTDGITAALIEDVWTGPDSSSPRHAAALGGWLYFSAEDARGRELWRTNGTDAEFVADIYPGTESSDPRWMTAVGSVVLFEARDNSRSRELWRSDGATTALVRDINPTGDATVAPSGDGPAEHFAVAGGVAFFQADDGSSGLELWRSDGASAALAGNIGPAQAGSQPEEMTVAGNRLFFAADQAALGTELWSLVLGSSADLAVALAAAPLRPRVGDEVTLTLTVRNLGPEATTGVRVGVDLPGVTVIAAPPSFAAGTWTVGALAGGATQTLQLTVRVDAESPLVGARILASDLTDPVAANDAASLALAPPAIVVGGACTLVLAIIAANTDAPVGACPAGSGADRIELAAASVHSFTTAHETAGGATALPSITSDITIAGHGAVVRRASGDFRLFRVPAGGALTLLEVTVRAGSSTVRGGGILAAGGRVTLEDSRLDGNIAPEGGAIASLDGDVTLTRTVVTDNAAIYGGGIATTGGSLTLVDSTVNANRAAHPTAVTFGGGIYANGALSVTGGTIASNTANDGGGVVTLGTATLTDAMIRANTASAGFGGIDNRGTLTMTGGEIVDNVAQSIGGGIGNLLSGSGSLRLTGVTVAGNRANAGEGGGMASWGAATVVNSTFSANPLDNRGTLALQSSTLVGGGLLNSGTATATGSIVTTCSGAAPIDGGGNVGCGVDPLLGPLADNGGPTRTHAPLPGSPAIDAGAGCEAVDQRGVARPLDGDGNGVANCDAGAVEAPAVTAIAAPVTPPPPAVAKPPLSKPATGVTGLKRTLTVSGSTIRLGTAKNPPTASTTQTLTTVRAGASAVVARGSTRIPAGGSRRLTLKLTPAGKRQLRRGTLRLRLRIVATGPDGARATITRTVKLKRRR